MTSTGPVGCITLSAGDLQRYTPGGHINLAARGFPNASQRGTKSDVAHKWAGWQHNQCRLGGPRTSERGTKLGVVDKWAGGDISPAAWGNHNALERQKKLEVPHEWGGRLHNHGRMRGPQRYRAGDKIRNGPQVVRAAT